MSFRESIQNKLKENRPNLSASSLKTYISILFNLHKNMKADGDDLEWFNHQEKEIMKYLEEKTSQTRKSVLSALFVLTGNDAYRELMLKDCGVVNAQYKEQKKSLKEADNWITTEKIKEIYEKLLAKVKPMFAHTIPPDYSAIMEFWLVSFLSGINIPPRRSMDYTELKINNYDLKTDNYVKGNKLYFNQYKTAKVYGLQTIDIPKELNVLIKKWIKMNPSDYFLFSSNKNKLTSPQVNRILNSAFGCNCSTDLLRHIYLTNLYGNVPSLVNMEKTASEMSHSLATALTYIKKD